MFIKSLQKLRDHRFVAPVLVGVYPVLSLLAANIAEIQFSDGIRSLLVTIVGTGLILVIFASLLRNREKAAILTSLVIILFFTYGHIYLFLESGSLLGLPLGRHRYLVPFNLIVFFVVGRELWRTARPITGVVRTVNLVAVLFHC